MELTVFNPTGKNTALNVRDEVFGATVNKTLLSQAVRVYLSNQRQGTSKVKTRSEINRTKAKWFKQKGTGNARHGAKNANIFVGGGVSHGPTGSENWNKTLSKKMKKVALASALSLQKDNIIVTTVLDGIKPKTKDAIAYLEKLAPDAKRLLIVVDKTMDNIIRSTNNLQNVYVTTARRVNVYEALHAHKIIMTKEAVTILEERVMQGNGTDEVKAKAKKEVAEKKPVVKKEKKVAVKKEAKKPVVKKTPAKKATPAKKKEAAK